MARHELTANYTDVGAFGTTQTGRVWPDPDTPGANVDNEAASNTGTGVPIILLAISPRRQPSPVPLNINIFDGTELSTVLFTVLIGEDAGAASAPRGVEFGPAGIYFANGFSASAASALVGVRIFWKFA